MEAPAKAVGEFLFEMNGGQMQDFEGTIIGYVPHQGLDQYHVLYEDNDRQYRSPDQIQQLIKFYSDHHARDQVPGHAPRLQEPGHELFNALIAHNGSVAANARHNGGFNFLAQKFKAGKLFELRDLRQHLPVPPPAQLHLIMETLKEVLSITDGFPSRSDERYILREFAQHSLNLLYAFGTHTDNVKKAARMFNNGEWESLWTRVQAKGQAKRAQLAAKPLSSAARSDAAKDEYAYKLAKAGNLGKANKIVTSEALPAIDEATVDKLAAKHPQRPLDQNGARMMYLRISGTAKMDKSFPSKRSASRRLRNSSAIAPPEANRTWMAGGAGK